MPVSAVIAIGPEIFIISGSDGSAVWIFDFQTDNIHRGPGLELYQPDMSVGFVGTKLYAIEGYSKIQARSLDLRKETNQSYETTPIPTEQREFMWCSTTTASLNRKVCSLSIHDDNFVSYDPKDGSCERFELRRYK
ncbi:hypothetical protein HID58_094300 [Brassica napus]|uniref:Uncharacterized protein n=1 Tax=Brassica napus TaxID=3708 RepID=A0ABQ7X7T0_BRANA|nr:hypothetical protein HID58_094300 [Brassica napus]